MAFLLEKEASYDKANERLGTKVKFKWSGFSIEEWESDLKTRINKIDITKKRAELDKLESRLDAIVSPEMRRSLELAAIMQELKES